MSATTAVAMLALMGVFSACSSIPTRDDPQHRIPGGADTDVVRHGTVTAIDVIPMAARSLGAGALRQAVVHAPTHSQAGIGIGRAPASGPGTPGGAAIGNAVEQRSKDDSEVYRISVRLDDGHVAQFDYQRIDDLRVGHRVRVEGGRLHRV